MSAPPRDIAAASSCVTSCSCTCMACTYVFGFFFFFSFFLFFSPAFGLLHLPCLCHRHQHLLQAFLLPMGHPRIATDGRTIPVRGALSALFSFMHLLFKFDFSSPHALTRIFFLFSSSFPSLRSVCGALGPASLTPRVSLWLLELRSGWVASGLFPPDP
jgi:hypothetical protein